MNSVHNHVLSSEKRAEKCASEVLDRIEKFSDPELGHFKIFIPTTVKMMCSAVQ